MCSGIYILHNDECVSSCPEQYYVQSVSNEKNNITSKLCTPCHYSCKTCIAGAEYECTECYGDASLYIPSNYKSYCYSKSMLNEIQSIHWYYPTYITLLLIVCSILVCVGLGYIIRKCCYRRHTYVHPETIQSIRKIEKSIKTSVYSDTE